MGFGGLTIDKIFVILLIALFILGPDKLPAYAKKLGELVRSVKHMADGAKDRLRDEMGPEFDDVDWKQLDPRQYDPRRIIRDALLEDEREAASEARQAQEQEAADARRAKAKARAEAVAAASVAAATVSLNQPESSAGVAAVDATPAGPKITHLHYDDEAT